MKFLVACATYLAAHVIDFLMTITYAIEPSCEGNILSRPYIEVLGTAGLMVFKVLLFICVSSLLGAVYLIAEKEGQDRYLKVVVTILYAGAVLTVVGGLLWLTT